MKHLKSFSELNEARSDRRGTERLVKLYAQEFEETKKPEEKLEDVEDILTEITDQWPLIRQWQGHPWQFFSKNPEVKKHPLDTNQTIYSFKLKPKFGGYMHPIGRSTWGSGKSQDYYNSDVMDKEVEEIKKLIAHSRLNSYGYRVEKLRWGVYEAGTWVDGIYAGKPQEAPYIELVIMEPSWWKSKPIPYKEVSDLEAGII
jgi:hypothetical protein